MQKLAALVALSVLGVGCSSPGDALDSGWKTTAGQTADWRDEVIYQVLVDRFANGDLSNDFNVRPGELGRFQGGDWQGLINHLDYLEELGVTALWISPVVRNLETDANFDSYHGYWQQDFEKVNPHFGDLGKLRELVNAAHGRNMKVILDIVTNHVGQLFYYDINGNGLPDDNVYGAGCGTQPPMDKQPCPSPAVITHLTEYDPDYDPQGIRGYTSLGFSGPAPVRWIYKPGINRMPTAPAVFANLDWYNKRGRITDYGTREQVLKGDFPGGLKDLDTSRPDVTAALTAVFAKWIQAADFDGFRIDTLKHVEHEFWQDFCGNLRDYAAGSIALPDPTRPDEPNATVPPLSVPKQSFFMFGESFDGNDELNGSYTQNGEVDSVFHFAQKFSVFDEVFKKGAPTKRIEDQIGRVRQRYGAAPHPGGIGVAPQQALVNFLDNHDVPRFLFDRPDTAALHNALAFLLTEEGIPCIYYGTEQQFSGGNDPYNREPLWTTGYKTDGETFQWIKRLTTLRKRYAPLRRGDLVVRWATERTGQEQDAGIFAFSRTYEGKTALVVINTSDAKTSETSASTVGGSAMTTDFAPGTTLVDVLADDGASEFQVGAGGAVTITVPARGARILVPQADVIE